MFYVLLSLFLCVFPVCLQPAVCCLLFGRAIWSLAALGQVLDCSSSLVRVLVYMLLVVVRVDGVHVCLFLFSLCPCRVVSDCFFVDSHVGWWVIRVFCCD